MIKISQQQAVARWDTLPEELREFLYAETTTASINDIFSALHIPETIQKPIRKIIGWILMGFIHAEDAAKEIQEATGMNSQHARELADSINVKLVSPFQDILEKIYSPVTEEIPEPKRISFDSIAPAKPMPAPSLQTIAPKPLEVTSSTAKVVEKSSSPAPMPAASPAPKINPFSILGSPTPIQGSQAQASVAAPAEPAKPAAPIIAKPAEPIKTTQAPFVIHTENKEPQVIQPPKFKFDSAGSSLSAFGSNGKTAGVPQIPKPAQIEIGREEKLKPAEPITKIESAPRTIHYSSLSSPINMAGGSTGGSGVKPVSFGNITPMPASPVGRPATPANEPASAPVPVPPAPINPTTPQTSSAVNMIKSTSIPVKNPLAQNTSPTPAFGRLVKTMITPAEKSSAVPSAPTSAPSPSK